MAEDMQAGLVRTIMASDQYRAAFAAIAAQHDRTVGDIVTLTEIPAPSWQEAARAEAFGAMLRDHGLTEVETDPMGNVMGVWKGTGGAPMVAIAAHLDTVFPEGTDVTVRRDGTRLSAPGIGDNTRSLAVLLAYIRAMKAGGIRTRSDILFVGDVGEERDLRGVRYLFEAGRYRDAIGTFIALDGTDIERVVTSGVGARKYRVTVHGPGGHSFHTFGSVNPSYALADAAGRFARMSVPSTPKTTHNVGVWGGGTSANSIPESVWADFEIRSESEEVLRRLDAELHSIVEAAVAAENQARSTERGQATAELRLDEDIPAGRTPDDAALVRLADAAIAAHGFAPAHLSAITDANVAMSRGIPAIKISSGGRGGRTHSLDEWIDVEPGLSVRGIAAGLTTLLAVAGMHLPG